MVDSIAKAPAQRQRLRPLRLSCAMVDTPVVLHLRRGDSEIEIPLSDAEFMEIAAEAMRIAAAKMTARKV